MAGKNNGLSFCCVSSRVEVRSKDDGKKSIKGVIPYDKESENLGYFVEIIRKGAFSRSVKDGDIICMWSHNSQYVLGRSSAKTLVLEDRDDGLHFECELSNASWASDVYEAIERGDVPGVSFGFRVVQDKWTRFEGDQPSLRELLDVDLFEISVGVAFPAYPDASASTRELFKEAGIDVDKVSAVLARAKCGNDCLNEDDVMVFRNAISSLEKFIPVPKPVSSEPAYLGRAREIEILEAETTIGD